MGGYGVVTLNSSFHCSELMDPRTRRSWSPFEPRFWCHTLSIGWSVILDVGLFSSVGSAFGTKIRAHVIFVSKILGSPRNQNNPCPRLQDQVFRAQIFLVGFTPPSMGHMGPIGSPVRQSWPNCWRHLAARMTRSACMLCHVRDPVVMQQRLKLTEMSLPRRGKRRLKMKIQSWDTL